MKMILIFDLTPMILASSPSLAILPYPRWISNFVWCSIFTDFDKISISICYCMVFFWGFSVSMAIRMQLWDWFWVLLLSEAGLLVPAWKGLRFLPEPMKDRIQRRFRPYHGLSSPNRRVGECASPLPAMFAVKGPLALSIHTPIPTALFSFRWFCLSNRFRIPHFRNFLLFSSFLLKN